MNLQNNLLATDLKIAAIINRILRQIYDRVKRKINSELLTHAMPIGWLTPINRDKLCN